VANPKVLNIIFKSSILAAYGAYNQYQMPQQQQQYMMPQNMGGHGGY
jgi:hypothetical protein